MPQRPAQISALSAVPPVTSGMLVRVEDSGGLNHALEQGWDGAAWVRPYPQTVCDWLDALPAQRLPEGRVILRSDQVSDCIRLLFSEAGFEDTPALTWLCQDAQALADLVADALNTSSLRLRLDAIHDDACRKFHVDNVAARLICTYRGPGTQVRCGAAPEGDIDRVATGHPVFLKGKLWPQDADISLEHRSPPILGTGLSRLMLVLESCQPEEMVPAYDRIFADARAQMPS